jgi:hypothetical protein
MQKTIMYFVIIFAIESLLMNAVLTFVADINNLDDIAKVAQGIDVAFVMTPPSSTLQSIPIGDTLKSTYKLANILTI